MTTAIPPSRSATLSVNEARTDVGGRYGGLCKAASTSQGSADLVTEASRFGYC
jgi:hypothetical protein